VRKVVSSKLSSTVALAALPLVLLALPGPAAGTAHPASAPPSLLARFHAGVHLDPFSGFA